MWLIGFGVSVFLHGVMLDFWRGTGVREGASREPVRSVVLRARMHAGGSENEVQEIARIAPVAALTTLSQRRVEAPAGLARPAHPAQQSGARTPLASENAVREPVLDVRPLSHAEGLVAYRLALLEILQPPPALARPLHLSLTFSGKPGSVSMRVSVSSGNEKMDQFWLAAIQHAVARADMPMVLIGEMFELELEVLPADTD